MSLVGPVLKDSKESRVSLDVPDFQELTERTASLETEVFQVRKERREAQVLVSRVPEGLQDLQDHLVREEVAALDQLVVLVTLVVPADRVFPDQ